MVWLFLESSHSESSSPWARASGDRVGGCVCLQASWCQEPLRSGKGWAMPSPGRTSLWSLGPLGGCSLPGLCCITAQVSSQLCAQVMFVLATFQPRVYGGQGGRLPWACVHVCLSLDLSKHPSHLWAQEPVPSPSGGSAAGPGWPQVSCSGGTRHRLCSSVHVCK